MSANAAPVLLPTPVDLWRAGIDQLSPNASPCRHLTGARWTAMRESCLDFIDRFGAEAHRLGWTAPELFAVHPEHGTMRLDYCGALMIDGAKARGVEATRVLYERTSVYRDTPGRVWGPPVWEYVVRGEA